MAKLAINGGSAVRTTPFPIWPIAGDEENSWLQKVLAGDRWFAGLQGDDPDTLGTLFGDRFGQLHGANYALPVSNGSVAIEIALRALDIGPGDEVIVPPYTFISTATSVLMVGAVPVFADIDPISYCLDPQAVMPLIGPKTKAILPVHLAGHMADMAEFVKLASQHQLALIEDCAQAIDSGLDDRKAGTWGDAGTFSFQSNKTITCGEGGLVMTNSSSVAEKVVALRAFGRFRNKGAVRSSDLTCQQISSNYRLSEFQSAVLLGQLERFAEQDDRRVANAGRLTAGIASISGLGHVRAQTAGMKHGYYYYLMRYDPDQFGNLTPEDLCRAFNAEGIPILPGDRKPLYRHPVFQPQNVAGWLWPDVLAQYKEASAIDRIQCPEAEKACENTLVLRHQVLLGSENDMDDIVEALGKVSENIDELTKRR